VSIETRLNKVESRVADDNAELAELTALLNEESPEEIQGILESLKRNGLSVADWKAEVNEVIAEIDSKTEASSPYNSEWSKQFAGYQVNHAPVALADLDPEPQARPANE
jgi:hypothetical protein